jgi:hypothetical protein
MKPIEAKLSSRFEHRERHANLLARQAKNQACDFFT